MFLDLIVAFYFQNLFINFSSFHFSWTSYYDWKGPKECVVPYYGKVFINCHVWNRELQNWTEKVPFTIS